MVFKLDRPKAKQELLHSAVNLGVVLVSMIYIHNIKDLKNIGKFWDSLVIPFIFVGEILKLTLAHYYAMDSRAVNAQQQKTNFKCKNSFSAANIILAIFIQCAVVVFYGFSCILLGAPVLQDYEQTCVLSIILTLLTVSPLVFLLGAGGTLQEVYIQLYKYHAIGAILGAWIGSVVVPLDWDQDWQEYPIPNVIGALCGSGISTIINTSSTLHKIAVAVTQKKSS
uniref:Glycosylphosphatidylinositol anchor biosynthesis protein 11 n=1 Tax=Megaselia scalaris TaxID=36166 RepID=T1GG03_MEGSC